jgi:hypothetical protein
MAIMKKLLLILLIVPYFGFSQVKIPISSLPTATGINTTDWFIINQGTTTKKIQYSLFKWDADSVAKQIHDSLVNYGGSVTLGTANQIPFMNGTTDFQYSENFKWNDATLTVFDARDNLFIGNLTGLGNTIGNYNVLIGEGSFLTGTSSEANVSIGNGAGAYSVGDSNIFVGFQAGYNETGSNKLYIENSNSATPLIYGNFADDSLIVNGTFKTTGHLISGDNFKWNDTTLILIPNTTNENNLFIGSPSTGNTINEGANNTFIGSESGRLINNGNENTFIGSFSGTEIQDGTENTFIGYLTGGSSTDINRNTFIGWASGYNSEGDSNIFIGYASGYNETGSNKLYIENSNSATPLIWGDFANDSVRINGHLQVTSGISLIGEDEGTFDTINISNNSKEFLLSGSDDFTFIGNSGYFRINDAILRLGNETKFSYLEQNLTTLEITSDTVRINGTLDVTLNLTADTITALEIYNKTKDHGFFAFEDSAVVINCTQDTWVQVTNATNTLFDGVQEGQGFDISGDTITFNADARSDLTPHIIFHWGIDGHAGNGEDYEVRIYNIDNTAGVVRKAEGTTSGANNRISIGTTSYDINSAYGDRYIMQIMNKTNSGDFTIENGSIYLEVSHY